MAPELVDEKNYNEKVDVWSTGVIAYILITGRPPFMGKTKDAIYQKILSSDPNYDDKNLQKCSDECIEFL